MSGDNDEIASVIDFSAARRRRHNEGAALLRRAIGEQIDEVMAARPGVTWAIAFEQVVGVIAREIGRTREQVIAACSDQEPPTSTA